MKKVKMAKSGPPVSQALTNGGQGIEAGQDSGRGAKRKHVGLWGRLDLLRCRTCAKNIPPEDMLSHVKECWGIKYDKLADIPDSRPFGPGSGVDDKPLNEVSEVTAKKKKAKMENII